MENLGRRLLNLVGTYRDYLIILSLVLGLFGIYQNQSQKEVKWVDGWPCSYWDSERNSYQSLMDNIVRETINGRGFNSDQWDTFKSKRDLAAEKFNRECLSPSSYFMK